MRQIRELSDERLRGFCVYCGRPSETRDHVPPRVFLDKPYPSNLPVVPACRKCNEKISIDEEYIACLMECVLSGPTSFESIEREKIARILQRKPKLVSRLDESRQVLLDSNTWFIIEADRIRKVVIKLARGHTAFELGEPQLDDPYSVFFSPLIQMDEKQLSVFESIPPRRIFPEVGSRGMQRFVEDGSGWVMVQPQRYRYLSSVNAGEMIRFVIREYLACEVVWLTS